MENLENKTKELDETRKIRIGKVKGIFSYLVGLGLAGGIAFCGFYAIRGCDKEARKNEEVKITTPDEIRQYIRDKEKFSVNLKVDKEFLLDEEYNRKKVEEYDKIIQKYGEEIRTRIEKGDLTPQHAFYEDYKDIYGNDAWWPKDKNEKK